MGWVKERYPIYDWVERNGRESGFYPDTEIAYGKDAEYIISTDLDVRTWMPGDTVESPEIKLPENIKQGEYKIEARIGGGCYPIVKLLQIRPSQATAIIISRLLRSNKVYRKVEMHYTSPLVFYSVMLEYSSP